MPALRSWANTAMRGRLAGISILILRHAVRMMVRVLRAYLGLPRNLRQLGDIRENLIQSGHCGLCADVPALTNR
jgi:hypothetical protein